MQMLAQPKARPQVTAAELDAKERAVTKAYHAEQAAKWAVGDKVLHRERRKGGMVRYLRGVIVKVTATRVTIEYNRVNKQGEIVAIDKMVVLPTTLKRVLESN